MQNWLLSSRTVYFIQNIHRSLDGRRDCLRKEKYNIVLQRDNQKLDVGIEFREWWEGKGGEGKWEGRDRPLFNNLF